MTLSVRAKAMLGAGTLVLGATAVADAVVSPLVARLGGSAADLQVPLWGGGGLVLLAAVVASSAFSREGPPRPWPS